MKRLCLRSSKNSAGVQHISPEPTTPEKSHSGNDEVSMGLSTKHNPVVTRYVAIYIYVMLFTCKKRANNYEVDSMEFTLHFNERCPHCILVYNCKQSQAPDSTSILCLGI